MTHAIDETITARIAKRQAEICLALVRETDRSVLEDRQSADQILAGFYRRHREYGARDRRFFSNAVFSWFRWRGWLKTPTDENIAAAILLDAPEIPAPLEYMLSPPALARADLKPLGALNLEDKMTELQDLFKNEPLRAEQLAPGWFADWLFVPPGCRPEAHRSQCLESFQARPPTWLRLRSDQTLRLTNLLAQMKIETGTHPFIKEAVFIKGSKNCDLSQLPGAEAQDLASQCVGICCDPKSGEQWWDACAGSGGKSFHLADLMHDQGLILATDVRMSILNQMSRRLNKNKYRSIRMSIWDGMAGRPAPGKYFDGVLVDAPCSGMGTWARNPDARWRTCPKQIRDYAKIQGNLLGSAASRVKPGGRLVYATCTLTTLENTGVIEHFLEQHREFKLEPVFNPLNRKQSSGLIWIWPWEWNCNGMFIAVMKKS